MKDNALRMSLRVPLAPGFLRMATCFAEEAARAFGFEHAEGMKLTLAGEEIFAFLSRVGRKEDSVTIEAADGGYYLQLTFLFHVEGVNLRALNLTTTVSTEDEESLEELGLLIASRSVESFHIAKNADTWLALTLIKDKGYPEPAEMQIPEIKPLDNFHIATPDAEELKLFVRLIAAHYPVSLCPASLRLPGKVVDMVASGDYGVKTAADAQGQTGGGVMWRWLGEKTVELFGPFEFNQQPSSGLSEALIDACIGELSRTDAIGLISRYPTPDLPEGYFEHLGDIDLIDPEGNRQPRSIHYRQLQEDPGCRVWAHPELTPFLETAYRRLFMPREIRLTSHEGEKRPSHSVFAPRFERANRQVTLRAIWDGADAAENLARHVKALHAENLPNIFFEVDLAHAWQADLAGALLAQGFIPRLILPYGGAADVVVFQYQGGS